MGFLKVRKVKKGEYFYWCKRTRSRKKFGGDGKVRSVEYCLGDFFLKWLPFHAYMGNVDFKDFVEQHINLWLKQRFSRVHRKPPVSVVISWEGQNPKLKGVTPLWDGLDCRTKEVRAIKESIKEELGYFQEDMDIHPSSIDFRLEEAAKCWCSYLEAKNSLQKLTEKQKEYEKDPERTWDHHKEKRWDAETMEWVWYNAWYCYPENYELTLDEDISLVQTRMDEYLKYFEVSLESLSQLIPKSCRETHTQNFKAQAQAKGEALLKKEKARQAA